MNTFIYLNNFRGFSKTTFELKDVNFFVGENSTGKTSVLALINSMLSPSFWFFPKLGNADYDFGGFRDILSAALPVSNEFSIGIFQIHKLKNGITKKAGLFASFKEHEGLPNCSFFSRIDDGRIIAIKLKDVKKYAVAETKIPGSSKNLNPKNCFEYLEKWRDSKKANFKKLAQKIPTNLGFLPLMHFMATVAKSPSKTKIDFTTMEMPFSHFSVAWLAPIRSRPRRTYDGYGKNFSPEGEHTPYVLRKTLCSKEKAKTFESALKQFGRASGLFKNVSVHNLGKGAAAPFEILVDLGPKALRIDSVGYGVSQVLPLLVEIILRQNETVFAIQQPEVHLHPKAQAELGNLVFQFAHAERKRFMVETHSDFAIDRYRTRHRETLGEKKDAQILFFERSASGNKVTTIPIMSNGDYSSAQPETFRNFFLKEQMSILGL